MQQGFLRIRGWAVADEPVKIQIFDENKQKLNVEILRTQRVDVEQLYEEMDSEDKSGFFVELTNLTGKLLYLVFYAGDTKSVHIVHLNPDGCFPQKNRKICKKRSALLESTGKCGYGRQGGIQGKNCVHKGDSLSEMDRPPSSRLKRTGKAEKDKI